MKVLIVSDTHGQHRMLDYVLEKEQGIDLLIHCGDLEGGEHYLKAVVTCPVYMVKGNNDFFSDVPREEEFSVAGYKVFLTHGHSYFVSLDYERIKEEGKERHADIIMFGHTHKPYLEEGENLTLLNPGSLSYPRQEGRQSSYIIMHVEEGKKPVFEQHYIVPAEIQKKKKEIPIPEEVIVKKPRRFNALLEFFDL